MVEHWAFISGRTLQDYQDLPQAEPFSEQFWLLNETEHGSDAPDRLHGFDLIRKHEARTPELDRELLVPYFLRYLWEVPYPNYTREAWRLLKSLVDDIEGLEAAALAILEAHPQGSLRAEVLAWRRDYGVPAYLESAAFEPVLRQLAHSDPAPDVRAEALKLLTARCWDYEYRDSEAGQTVVTLLLDVLQNDLAPSVRGVAFDLLADPSVSGQAIDASKAALILALQRPDNICVFPGMMASYGRHCLSGLRVSPDRVGAALNALAQHRGHPLFADMVQPLTWFIYGIGDPAGPLCRDWLPAAPFADGDALVAFATSRSVDGSAGIEARALALVALEKFGRPCSRQAFVDFLLDPDQTHVAQMLCTKAYSVMRGLWTGPVQQADAPSALLAALIAHSRSRPMVDEANGGAYRQALCDYALRQALWIDELPEDLQVVRAPAAQALLDAVLESVRSDHADLSFALYELGRKPTRLSVAHVRDVIQSANHPRVGRATAARMATRFETLREEAALGLIEAALAHTHDRDLIADVVDELPSQADLGDQPDQLARLIAAVRTAHARVPVGGTEYEIWVASKTGAWLTPDLEAG